MARRRIIKWREELIDTGAIADADREILRDSVAALTRGLLAQIDAIEPWNGFNVEGAVDLAKRDIDRIAQALFPAHFEQKREYEASVAARRSREKKKAITPGLRMTVFERDGFRCRACGTQKQLSAAHVIPKSKGGPTTLENLQTLCRPCNSRKGGRHPPAQEEGRAEG